MDIETLRNDVKAVMPDVISWRRHFHKNPETGFDLDNTIDFVSKTLDSFGIENEVNKENAYVIAYVNKGKEGRTLAVRADMDALPVQEETGLEYASEIDGKMHACGHDAHIAMLLGIAKVLNDNKDKLNGSVKFLFQPAEELGTGSVGLIKDGVLNGVDEILGVHNGRLSDEAEPGDMVFSTGSFMATMDRFRIKVNGKGAHGSTPQDSIDPITITSYIITSLQEILSRETDPRNPGVVSIGTINAGNTFNVIPEACEIEGTTRTFTNEMRDFVEKRIGEISKEVAGAFRAEVDYEYMRQPPPLVNDSKVAEKLINISKELYPENTVIMTKPCMAGEDFAWYLQEIPGAYFFLHNPLEIDGQCFMHHNAKFAIDEEYLNRPMEVIIAYVENELA